MLYMAALGVYQGGLGAVVTLATLNRLATVTEHHYRNGCAAYGVYQILRRLSVSVSVSVSFLSRLQPICIDSIGGYIARCSLCLVY